MTKVDPDQRRPHRARPVALTLGALALALLPGCVIETGPKSSTVSASGSEAAAEALISARQEAFQIDHEKYRSLGYRLDWKGFPVVSAGKRIIFLDLYPDIVVAQESAATVSILEANTGELRNSSQVASPLTRLVGNFRTGDHIVVSSDNEAVVIETETGSMIDRQHFSRVVSTHPVFIANQMIFGTAIGHVYSRALSPPVDMWAFDMGSPIDVAPVLVDSFVVAISRRGDIAVLDASSGTLISRASIYGGCEAAPVAGEGAFFLASLDQSVYAFNLSGRQIWRVRTEQPLRVTPTYHQGVLYVQTADQGLRALDAATGTQLWNQKSEAGRVIGIRGGRLITWDGRKAAALDPANGDVITSAALPGVAILKPDALVDGNLYAVSEGGLIAKFQPNN